MITAEIWTAPDGRAKAVASNRMKYPLHGSSRTALTWRSGLATQYTGRRNNLLVRSGKYPMVILGLLSLLIPADEELPRIELVEAAYGDSVTRLSSYKGQMTLSWPQTKVNSRNRMSAANIEFATDGKRSLVAGVWEFTDSERKSIRRSTFDGAAYHCLRHSMGGDASLQYEYLIQQYPSDAFQLDQHFASLLGTELHDRDVSLPDLFATGQAKVVAWETVGDDRCVKVEFGLNSHVGVTYETVCWFDPEVGYLPRKRVLNN